MLTQKIFKNGNSVAVVIPKQYLKELHLRDGSEVVVEKKEQSLVIRSKKQELASDVDPKFMKMVDEFIQDHKDVLTELAQK